MKRWKPIAWMLVSLLCFVAAWYAWQWGERRAKRDASHPSQPTSSVSSAPAGTGSFHLVSQPAAGTNRGTTNLPPVLEDAAFPYRLRNTPASLGTLMRSETAVLLENALVDTSRRQALAVPDDLRAKGDPGTYIVQSRGAITEALRQLIAANGGTIVSYVPNNAYLVRASAGASSAMGASPLTQAVMPFEPYYKLKGDLLKMAVEQKPLPVDSVLRVVLFPDASGDTKQALTQMGGKVLAEDRSPFGPVLTVQVPPQGLSAVAGLTGVQIIDRAYMRVPAVDLTRPRLGVATTSTVPVNYLGLTGSGVVVQVVDSGVDATHPDLTGRVIGDPASLTDTDGHGTHVAGIIAGDGSVSAGLTNVSGSVTPTVTGQFRGMAPAAKIYSISAIGGNVSASDRELQESAALTNAPISNNSWRQLGNTTYDITAASYDAAVRDALPLTNGSQPVLFVFAAGNEGDGNDDGTGGLADTIGSPATAKNVITVGAIEQLRDITNDVVICSNGTNDCQTQTPFADRTDSDDQVAYFSSRGNVGVGLEGANGRFKPDVVAPGEFVISTRSQQWDTNAYYNPTNFVVVTYGQAPEPPVAIFPGELWNDQPFVDSGVVEWTISVGNVETSDGPLTNAAIPIYVRSDQAPTTSDSPLGTNQVTFKPSPTGTGWFVGVGNPIGEPIFVEITYVFAVTNTMPFITKGLKQENAGLAPYYRYESGTSMSAPAVSGVLALLQEYYTNTFHARPSPALLKALLINGSRSVSGNYHYGDAGVINAQGWGLFNLPNILPAISNGSPAAVRFYDQTVTNSLVTAQRQTRTVHVNPAALGQPLRFTLVWTDPPGNPLVATKLVNDLDLVVTNLVTGEVYFGNYFDTGSDFSAPLEFSPTNNTGITNLDMVNNVENIIVPGNTNAATASDFSVTVIGRRVNVNSVYTHPDNTVQDYALVISCGDGTTSTALAVTDGAPSPEGPPEVNFLTPILETPTNEAVMALDQRVGENTPLLGNTNGLTSSVNSGITNQWRFYGVTNTFGFTNASFVTFLPSTLSIPRMGVYEDSVEDATRLEADIDLYVTQDGAITNLDPTAINNAYKSLGRGGTESIVLSNAQSGIYYVGVKSEDHEGANFSLFAAFTLLPTTTEDAAGITLQGIPLPAPIPDGSPQSPKAARVLAVAPAPINVRRVVVTNELTHQNFGDLVGNLSHDRDFVVLNNHTWPLDDPAITNYTYIYDDLEEGDIPGAQTTDGPGSLRNFSGKPGVGVWLLSMVDDALSQTGRVDNLLIRLERSAETNLPITRAIQPNGSYTDVIEVPADGTNLTVCVDIISSIPQAVELLIKRDGIPTMTDYDLRQTINPPGDCGSISTMSLPPLQPGNYFFTVFNPSTTVQTVSILVTIQIGVDGRDRQTYSAVGQEPVTDNAVSYARQYVEDDRRIAGLEVGLVVEHPRVSDLVTHLISPTGKRILLVENRGGTSDAGYGGSVMFTNAIAADSGGAAASTNTISVGGNTGTLTVNYNFYNLPDQMRVYYDNLLIKDTGSVSNTGSFSVDFGPGTATNLVITVNEGGNTNATTVWDYTATVVSQSTSYLVLTEDQDKTTTPIKFALPPLGGVNLDATGTVVFAAGFEGVAAGSYAAPVFINGWQVLTNDVEVFTGAAAEGANFVDINGDASSTGFGDGILLTNVTLTPGQSYQLSFAYARNPDSITNGMVPSAEVSLGAEVLEMVRPLGTNSWTNLMWQSLSVPFIATGTNMPLQVASLTTGTNGVLFDNFQIAEAAQTDRYYLPEESLNTLIGDNALGWWSLELWDNRAGASNGPPTVVSWQLRFIYATVVQLPVPVTPGVAITNTIPPGEILLLQVQVPNWANYATNTLLFATPDPVDVWFNQSIPPALGGTNTGDFPLLPNSLGGSATLNTEGIPPLMPGQAYFVGIENPGTNTVTVAYRVDFDITPLTEGVPLDGTLGTNQFGGFYRMFYYDVPTNLPMALSFDLLNLSANVNMVARFGQTADTAFDYQSSNTGTNAENITILTNSLPVPLQPGRWFVEVQLADVPPADYTLLVTGITNLPTNIIQLTNGIAYFNTNNGVAPIQDYYRFSAIDPVARLQFEILGPTEDMTLLVSKGVPPPSLADFDYLSANPGTNDEYILVLPDSSPVVASAGEWFLTALNLSGSPASYAIKATQWAETGQPILLGPPSVQAGSFCFSWNSLVGAKYVVQAKMALSDTNWVDYSGTITATDTVTSYCVPLPSPYHFFRVIEGVAVETGSAAQFRITSVASGPGGITLEWQAPPTYQFQVQWTDSLSAPWNTVPTIITSTDGTFSFTDDGTQTAPLGPMRFYRLVLVL